MVPECADTTYLWLNFALFEMLVGSENEVVEDVFRDALQCVKNVEGRKRLWLEYVFHSVILAVTPSHSFTLLHFLSPPLLSPLFLSF